MKKDIVNMVSNTDKASSMPSLARHSFHKMKSSRITYRMIFMVLASLFSSPAHAALNIPITVHVSESVIVTGTPRITVDVGGTNRYANYSSGTGTDTLTFTLSPQAGDVDLDGVTVSSPIDLNGGTIKDTKGNDATLTFTPPSTTNVKVNYPSLGMDFVYDADGRYTLNGTAYNDLSSFLTAAGGSFTRASIGTYFDSTGTLQTAASGMPRFDYDPTTLAAKGILLEESRTNMALRSSEMENAIWGRGASITVTANTTDTLAPDGTYSAEKIATNSSAAVIFTQSGLSVSGTSATYSVFLKQGSSATSANNFCMRNQTTNTNLICGSLNYATNIFTYSLGSSGVSVQTLPNGWKRLIMTVTSGITAGNQLRVYIGYTGGVYGAGLYVYAWGAQLETGSFATSYIPTTTTSVTRAADFLQIPTGSWFSATHGSLFANSVSAVIGAGNYRRVAEINDGTSSNRFFIGDGGNPTSTFAQVQTANVVEAALTVGVVSGAVRKQALAYQTNDVAYVLNNGALNVDTTVTLPSVTTLYLGSSFSSGVSNTFINGWISEFKYYPARVSDTQLQLLTQ